MSDPAAASRTIARFGADMVHTTNREKRAAMSSPLYDMQGRSMLGFIAVNAAAPELIERLGHELTPEQVGGRMRDVLMRPYFLQVFILFEGFLMARQRNLVGHGGSGAGEEAATVLVADWVERVCRAYRNDDNLFPGAVVLDQPILAPEQVGRWAGGEALREELAARAQRAIGQIELYALTVHGEQRDGNFDHGPYLDETGRQIVFHEINDLANDFLPWVGPEQRLGLDAVGIVRSYDPGARITFDIFGTSAVQPSGSPFRQHALLAREGETVRRIEVEELEEIAARATVATGELFAKIAKWEPDYRTGYGRPLFLNHLLPFARLAGSDELEAWLREEAAREDPAELEAARDETTAAIWARFAGSEEIFSPIQSAVLR